MIIIIILSELMEFLSFVLELPGLRMEYHIYKEFFYTVLIRLLRHKSIYVLAQTKNHITTLHHHAPAKVRGDEDENYLRTMEHPFGVQVPPVGLVEIMSPKSSEWASSTKAIPQIPMKRTLANNTMLAKAIKNSLILTSNWFQLEE